MFEAGEKENTGGGRGLDAPLDGNVLACPSHGAGELRSCRRGSSFLAKYHLV